MRGKIRYLAIAAGLLLALAAIAVAANAQPAAPARAQAVQAQTPQAQATPPATCPNCGAATGQQGRGPMQGGGMGWGSMMYDDDSAVASLLGLTPTEIAAQRRAGKSLAQIAEAKGVSKDKLVETILADRKAALDERVKAGALTADQAKAMLANMETMVRAMVDNTATGPMMGRGNGDMPCLGDDDTANGNPGKSDRSHVVL